MATYVYRCPSDGNFDLHRPLGQAAGSAACPACGAAACRVFTTPLLGALDRGQVRAYDDAARSVDQPGVVAAPPGWRRPPRPVPNPALTRLPRP